MAITILSTKHLQRQRNCSNPTAPPPPPPINFNTSQKPKLFSWHKIEIVKQPGCFDLQFMGDVRGLCLHCKSPPSSRQETKTSLHKNFRRKATIHTGHSYSNTAWTEGGGWQSYKYSYVETLPMSKQQRLNTIIFWASYGMNMLFVILMRNGSTAASLQKTSRANMSRWWSALKADYPGCIYCRNDCASTSPCGLWECKSLG